MSQDGLVTLVTEELSISARTGGWPWLLSPHPFASSATSSDQKKKRRTVKTLKPNAKFLPITPPCNLIYFLRLLKFAPIGEISDLQVDAATNIIR